jgi:hypothetical protein
MYPSNPTDRSCVQLIERLMPRVKKCHSLRRWGLDVSWTRPCSWLQCPRPDESASNPVPRLPLRSIHPAHRGKLRATWYTDRLLRHPIWFSAAPKSIGEANWWKSGSGGRRRSSRGAPRSPPIPPSRRLYPWPQVSRRSSPNPPPLARIPAPLSLAASPIALVSSRHRLGRAIRFPTSAVGSKCSGRVPGLSQRIRFYSVRGVRFLSAVAHSLGLSCRRFALRNCWVGGTVVSDTMYLHISHKEKQ